MLKTGTMAFVYEPKRLMEVYGCFFNANLSFLREELSDERQIYEATWCDAIQIVDD